MKISKRQLKRIIREAVESQYYKDLKKRGSERGEITRAVKEYSEIVYNDVENLIKNLGGAMDPLEKKHSAFATLQSSIADHFKEVQKEYNEKIRDPKMQRSAEEAEHRKALDREKHKANLGKPDYPLSPKKNKIDGISILVNALNVGLI